MNKNVLGAVALGLLSTSNANADDFKIKGDLRYRHDQIKKEKAVTRDRQRIRLRLGFYKQVEDNLKIGIRLASGGSDPVSTNQSLDGSFSTKGIQLDLAYFDLKLHDFVHIIGGKIKNPVTTSSKLVWDGDLNPEGLAAVVPLKLDDSLSLTFTAGQFWVEENSKGDDVKLNVAQLKAAYKADSFSTEIGASAFQYTDLKGKALTEGSGGNSVDSDGLYLNDYSLTNVFATVKAKPAGVPVKVFADYVTNTEADKDNNGSIYGIQFGEAKYGKTAWKLAYEYRSIEKDSVIGTFTDSDFGTGGANAEGSVYKAGYAFTKATAINYSFYDVVQDPNGPKETDIKRHLLDLVYKF